MPLLTLDTHLIWFAHCPKAGGTSVETFMVETWGQKVGFLQWGWDLWWKQGGWRVATPPNSPQHLIWRDAERVLPAAPDAVFALVRDPAARMASEHRYQRQHRRGSRAGRALAFLPFSLWLRLMLRVARRNPYAFDNHLRQQSDFIPEHAKVFRLENGIEPAINWLAEIAGISEVTACQHQLATGQTRDAPDARSLARIVAAFGEDYRRFGYPLPEVPPLRVDVLDWIAGIVAPLVVAIERRGCL